MATAAPAGATLPSSRPSTCGVALGAARYSNLPLARENGECGAGKRRWLPLCAPQAGIGVHREDRAPPPPPSELCRVPSSLLAGIAFCRPHQCCSQYGRCDALCASTCQCEFSGRRSWCPGSTLLTNVGVPVAPPAGACGPGVATCPAGQCCSVLGLCTTDCISMPCAKAQSGPGSACKRESLGRHACGWVEEVGAPPGACLLSSHQKDGVSMPAPSAAPHSVTRRYHLELEWGWGAPDGFSRPLIKVNGRECCF